MHSTLSVTNSPRNSSVELFRILSMFLVILVHMNGWFLVTGHGITETLSGEGYNLFVNKYIINYKLLHEYIQSLASVCVNCFIFISGYYGIKLKIKSIWNLFLTVVCVTIPFSIFIYFQDPSIINIKNILLSAFGLTGHGYFIQCYAMLLFVSPILNSFIDKYNKKILIYVISFVIIEGYVSMFRQDQIGFQSGYSVLHFILLYLIARCLYLYRDNLCKIRNIYYLLIYFGGALLASLIYIQGFERIYSYTSPLNILMSIALFIPFTKKVYYNKFINTIAASTFTAYVINTCSPGQDLYVMLDNYVFNHYNLPLFYILVICIISFLFFASVIYDHLLKFITKPINKMVSNFIDKRFKSNILN